MRSRDAGPPGSDVNPPITWRLSRKPFAAKSMNWIRAGAYFAALWLSVGRDVTRVWLPRAGRSRKSCSRGRGVPGNWKAEHPLKLA
jgi:hypothetical protein